MSAIAILTKYELNHARLDAWRQVEAKQERGEEIYPLEQDNSVSRSLSSEGLGTLIKEQSG